MTTSQLDQTKLEEFDAFVERLKDMIPFSALAPVDENAILKSKFMPKRSKIVSGKVIAAVEKGNKSRVESKVEEAVVSTLAAVTVQGDIKARFQSRKEELETNRKANDPVNIRRAEKRRAAEEKKKGKHQQKRVVDSADAVLKKSPEPVDSRNSKKIKSGNENVEQGANFVFNRLDENEKSSVVACKKTLSDPKQALQKLQAQKGKLEKLKATDAEKAAALEEKLQIKKALQKAEGISIKDDVNLLKKSIQRREKEKNKSRETWTKNKTDQKESVDNRQAKRTENIQARIDAKKNKKMGIKVKKTQKPGKKGSKFNKKK